eukprot:48807-Chlamydomonas_euryale.AAC.2
MHPGHPMHPGHSVTSAPRALRAPVHPVHRNRCQLLSLPSCLSAYPPPPPSVDVWTQADVLHSASIALLGRSPEGPWHNHPPPGCECVDAGGRAAGRIRRAAGPLSRGPQQDAAAITHQAAGRKVLGTRGGDWVRPPLTHAPPCLPPSSSPWPACDPQTPSSTIHAPA